MMFDYYDIQMIDEWYMIQSVIFVLLPADDHISEVLKSSDKKLYMCFFEQPIDGVYFI